MSAGNFDLAKYELDDGTTIVPVVVQPETMALTNGTLANDEPAGAVNLSLRAKTRKGNTEYGIGCRCISLRWNGAPPTGYSAGSLTVPILTVAAYAAYNVGDSITYLGATADVIGKKPEALR